MQAQKIQSTPRWTILLVVVWLVIVVSGFWWFQFKDLREFATDSSVVFFEGSRFDAQLGALGKAVTHNKDQIIMVHFWDPECSCNRFNEPHVKELIEKYSQQNIQFVIVARVAEVVQTSEVLARAKKTFNHPAVIKIISGQDLQLDAMPSTPAVAVMNGKQNLVYFGPYSVGAVCNVKNGAFVEKTLEQMSEGQVKKQLNVLASGCFCSWNDKSKLI